MLRVAIIHTENAMIVEFPRSRMRRILSRQPRRSKNGTPEERAAKSDAASAPPADRVIIRRRSKNGTFQERQANRTVSTTAVLAFPRGKNEPQDLISREELEQRIIDGRNRLKPSQRAKFDSELARIAGLAPTSDEPGSAA